MLPRTSIVAVVVWGFLTCAAWGEDWPTWRYDVQRRAASPQQLAGKLYLQWVRAYPALKPAWPDQAKMQFDVAYEPIVVGKALYLGSPLQDWVAALDVDSGREKWRFFADGPVRFAPAVWEGRLYFTADDGYLYCLDAGSGQLLWKFRGGPSDRKVLGNERLVSTWPARGAPVVADGTVYFAASIWPFMGIFIHALDARTGEIQWTNDGDGSIYMKQPHNTDSFASVAPQGPLVINGDKLLVPGGRSVPASFDRRTGKFLRYPLAENGKRGGGFEVATTGSFFFNGGAVFDLATAKWLGNLSKQIVLEDRLVYAVHNGAIRAYDLHTAGPKKAASDDSFLLPPSWGLDQVSAFPLPANTSLPLVKSGKGGAGVETLIKAGSHLYAATGKQILAIDFQAKVPDLTWQTTVDGQVVRLVAAAQRLFAVTLEGKVLCFGDRPALLPDASGREVKGPIYQDAVPSPLAKIEGKAAARARHLLENTNVKAGYGVVWGAGDGGLITELIRQSNLHLIVVDPDPARVLTLRQKLAADGLYGLRAAVHVGGPETFPLPPYLASLVIADDLESSGSKAGPKLIAKVFQSLRPFGGVACWLPPLARGGNGEGVAAKALAEVVATGKLVGAEVQESQGLVLLRRQGPLPNSANWTHEHGNAANTRVSRDKLVKAPLGILWFGGPSHDGILPRHGHGPQPQVIDGRLIIEGVNSIRALDIYTGRLLWETPLPGLGRFFNNLSHQPGANASGGNYVSTPDGIYVVHNRSCLRLDPATGKKMAEFSLPGFTPPSPPLGKGGKEGVSPLGKGGKEGVPPLGKGGKEGVSPLGKGGKDGSPSPGKGPDGEGVSPLGKEGKDGSPSPGKGPDGSLPSTKRGPDGSLPSTKRGPDGSLPPTKRGPDGSLPPTKGGPENSPPLTKGGKGGVEPPLWGYLNVCEDFLIGGADPLLDPKTLPPLTKDSGDDEPEKPARQGSLKKVLNLLKKAASDNYSASKHLVVMDRHSGKVLWTATARHGFRHNGICAGGGRLYALDRLSGIQLSNLQRRGEEPAPYRLVAFNLHTGKELWHSEDEVFGTWLSYSAKHDVVVEAGRVARDSMFDEPKGMRAYKARTGKVLWHQPTYLGPAMIHGDTILQGQGGCDLMTGAEKMRRDPLTDQLVPWRWVRNYGCNTPAASEHLLTFRSGAAGFFDLRNDGGTGNFGGFRSSCTNNLIVAGGVITAPEYTRTCTCSYQNQTSLALIHMPEAEIWTTFGSKEVKGPVRRVGINFGAPGDRRTVDGTLWLEYPSVAGYSPALTIQTTPPIPPLRRGGEGGVSSSEGEAKDGLEFFRRHSSQVAGPWNWVAASGAKGLTSVTLLLRPDLPGGQKYTVRLIFLEPERRQAGQRIFSVALQGREVIKDLDIVKAAGGSNRALVKEFRGVWVEEELTVRLTPSAAATVALPILCGLEVQAEEPTTLP